MITFKPDGTLTSRSLREIDENNVDGDVNIFKDLALAVPRGIEGAVQGIYGLADFVTFDALPDYDERFLGRSETIAGGFVEGAANFMTGFVPIAGQLGKVGQAGRLAVALKAAKGTRKAKDLKRAYRRSKFLSDVGAGAITDFTVFDAHEERLSDFIQNTALANPVSEFLAADKNDNELVGRLKNTIEGLFLEAGVAPLGKAFTATLDRLKAGKELRDGQAPEEEMLKAFRSIMQGDVDFDQTIELGNQFDTFVKETFGAVEGNPTVYDMASKWLETDASKSDPFAPMLREILANSEQTLRDTEFGALPLKDIEEGTRGDFDPETQTVRLPATNLAASADRQTFLHEIVHATTVKKIEETIGEFDRSFFKEGSNIVSKDRYLDYLKELETRRASLEKADPTARLIDAYLDAVTQGKGLAGFKDNADLIDTMRRRSNKGEFTYGYANILEFASEFLSNRNFAFQVGIEGRGRSEKWYVRIMEALRDLLGISTQYRGAFNDALSGIQGIIRETEADFTPTDRRFKNRSLEISASKSFEDDIFNNRTRLEGLDEEDLARLDLMELERSMTDITATNRAFSEERAAWQSASDEAADRQVELFDEDGVEFAPDGSERAADEGASLTEDLAARAILEDPETGKFLDSFPAEKRADAVKYLIRERILEKESFPKDITEESIRLDEPSEKEFNRQLNELADAMPSEAPSTKEADPFRDQLREWAKTLPKDQVAKLRSVIKDNFEKRVTRDASTVKAGKKAAKELAEGSGATRDEALKRMIAETRVEEDKLYSSFFSSVPRLLNEAFDGKLPKAYDYILNAKTTKDGVPVSNALRRRALIKQILKDLKVEVDPKTGQLTKESRRLLSEGRTVEAQAEVSYESGVKGVTAAEAAGKGISVLRKEGEQHYGNPFSHLANARDAVKTGNLQETVDAYRAWLEGTDHTSVKQERRQWVLDQIDSGALDGKKLLYYSKQTPNHAEVLAEFISKRRGGGASKSRRALLDDVLNKSLTLVEAIQEQQDIRLNAGWRATWVEGQSTRPSTKRPEALSKKALEDIRIRKNKSRYALDYGRELDMKELTSSRMAFEKSISSLEESIKEAKKLNNTKEVARLEKQLDSFKKEAKIAANRSDIKKAFDARIDALEAYLKDSRELNNTIKVMSLEKELDLVRKEAKFFAEQGYEIDRVKKYTKTGVRTDQPVMIAKLYSGETDELFLNPEPKPREPLVIREGERIMGSKALDNALDNIGSSMGLSVLLRNVVDDLRKTLPEQTDTFDDLTETTKNLTAALGGSNDAFASTYEAMLKRGESLNDIRLEQAAVFRVMSALDNKIRSKAKELQAKGAENVTASQKAEFLEATDRLYELGRIWNLYGNQLGRSLVQRKALMQGDDEALTRGILPSVEQILNKSPMNNKEIGVQGPRDTRGVSSYVNQKGVESDQAFADRVNDFANATSTEEVAKIAKGMHGSKLMDIVLEYWTNSLLSGPTTQIVNIVGNGALFALRMLETTMGAALTANPALLRASLGAAFSFEGFGEALKLAVKAGRTGDNILTQGSKAFDDGYISQPKITAKNVGEQLGNLAGMSQPVSVESLGAWGSAVNFLGKAVRLPSSLLQGGDEFFKQINYRYMAKTMLAYDAIANKNMRGAGLQKYLAEGYSKILQQGRAYNQENLDLNWYNANVRPKLESGEITADEARKMDSAYRSGKLKDKEGKLIAREEIEEGMNAHAETALKFARENTFTEDLDPDTMLGAMGNAINNLKRNDATRFISFIVPFVRTPTNIIKTAIDRTPAGVEYRRLAGDTGRLFLSKMTGKQAQLKSAILSKDPTVRAAAVGQVATGTMFASTALYYAMNSSTLGLITGAGPADSDRRRALQMSGWQPYSIKIGDKYWSYNKLDPISSVVGIYVDMVEAFRYQEVDGDFFENAFSVLAMSTVNNIANKSFLQGISNVMDVLKDPLGATERAVGDVFAGFVPTAFQQVMNFQQVRELKEARGFADRIIKRTPLSDRLMPKRNALGEKVMIENTPLGPLVPSYIRSISDDPVDQEIARLNKGFSIPKPKIMNTFDMRKFVNEDGQTAYDRFQQESGNVKINGLTLREALNRFIQSPTYKRLPAGTDAELGLGVQPPRVKALQKIINRYRRVGKSKMFEDFPELQDEINNLLQKRSNIRNGIQ